MTRCMLFYLVLGLVFVYAHGEDVHEKVFSSIYAKAFWGKNGDGIGYSGSGSLLKNTRPYIKFLQNFLKEKQIKSVVDAGCGDWEFSKHIDWTDVTYYGFDVVKSVVERNSKLYAVANIHFFADNFLTCPLPSADLLVCKDVLQHLSNADIFVFLRRLSTFKYCLITNDFNPRWNKQNTDIVVNGYARPLDLSKHPYNIVGTAILTYTTAEHGVFIPHNQKQIFLVDNSKNMTNG